jgi:hypothetical protein
MYIRERLLWSEDWAALEQEEWGDKNRGRRTSKDGWK